MSVEERFLAKVKDGPGGCWLWTAGVFRGGYGQFWNGERKEGAHRWAYRHLVGPIPEGMQLDHLCRVPACVNPDHLEPVTHQENGQRGIDARGRTARCGTRSKYNAGCRCRYCRAANAARWHADRRAA